MRFEDIKQEFPKMPEEMKMMIEREVEKQIREEHPQILKSKKTTGKILAASVAAVLLLSTTAFAGVSIYRMQRQQIAEHAVKVSVSGNTEQASVTEAEKEMEIPNVKMEVGYLPDGMVQTEKGKYSFSDALHQGGVTITFYRMDTGDDKFEMLHNNVLSSEEITLNGYDGVYLEYPHLYEEEIAFNQRIYAAFTDVHYVMELYAASDVEKEEALKIARGIKLTPTEESGDQDLIRNWNWSDYLESEQAGKKNAEGNDPVETACRDTVSKEEMKHTHAIGERFSMEHTQGEGTKGLVAKVSDVQVSDDLSLLDPAQTDEDFQKETDSSGKLRPATIQYIREGDENSLSEVIKSREAAQKLVYVTVEYTNTGEKELKDVLFMGTLARICEDGDKMRLLSNYEEPEDGDAWTYAQNRGLSGLFEMQYYDVHGGERKNNYITSIKPDETVRVHMGWIVTEEELGKLYLTLDTFGGIGEFTDSSLALGYVDIRQGM